MSPQPQGPARKGGERNLRFGWWSLLAFLSLGIALEAMHGFKIGWYLDVAHETRRLLWRLAHAHGVLLALVNVAFGLSWPRLRPGPTLSRASLALIGATVLLPLGFFLGGLFVYGGDPWIGVFLVPPGALFLFLGVFFTARST